MEYVDAGLLNETFGEDGGRFSRKNPFVAVDAIRGE